MQLRVKQETTKNGIQWLACAYIALLFGAIGLLAAIYHRSKILISASSFPLIWFFNTNFCISFCETKKMISSDFYMKKKEAIRFFTASNRLNLLLYVIDDVLRDNIVILRNGVCYCFTFNGV